MTRQFCLCGRSWTGSPLPSCTVNVGEHVSGSTVATTGCANSYRISPYSIGGSRPGLKIEDKGWTNSPDAPICITTHIHMFLGWCCACRCRSYCMWAHNSKPNKPNNYKHLCWCAHTHITLMHIDTKVSKFLYPASLNVHGSHYTADYWGLGGILFSLY